MVTKILKSGFVLMLITILFAFDLEIDWFKAGSKPKSYEMISIKENEHSHKNVYTIKSIDRRINGFGTLMQDCLPDKYLGKRIKMSGLLKTKNVTKWAGFWLRLDQKGSAETLGFDNMHDGKKDRSIKGTTEWTSYEIVLDVPNNTSNIAYGTLLAGTGQIWFDNITLEIVDNSIKTTN